MSYSIRIGEMTIGDHDAPHVERVEDPDAPTFPNDGLTGSSNERCPSYTAWGEFARAVNLHAFFFDERTGLMREHPGCQPFGERHLWIVEEALVTYRERQSGMRVLPPGFAGYPYMNASGRWVTPAAGEYDAHLARLIWLEWWMRRALTTGKRPAIWNV